ASLLTGRRSSPTVRPGLQLILTADVRIGKANGGGSRVTWQFVLAGLFVGTLVGMTGMGGGSLMTPILVLLLGFNPSVAIGTDIAHGAIFKSFGAIRHRRLGNVQARLSGWMFVGSAPASIVGVMLATWLERHYGDSINSAMSQVLGAALLFG